MSAVEYRGFDLEQLAGHAGQPPERAGVGPAWYAIARADQRRRPAGFQLGPFTSADAARDGIDDELGDR